MRIYKPPFTPMAITPTNEETKQKLLDAGVAAQKAYSSDLHKKDKHKGNSQNFLASRNMLTAMTSPRPVQGNLFSQLEEEDNHIKEMVNDCRRKAEEERKRGNHEQEEQYLQKAKDMEKAILLPDAKKLHEEGNLLSIISDGINGSVAEKKVIIYIARELHRQMSNHDGIDGLVKMAEDRGLPITIQNGIKYPYLPISLGDAAFYTKGANNNTNRNDIYSILAKHDKCINFIKSENGKRHIKLRLFSIEGDYKNELTGKREVLLMLRPIFFNYLTKSYVTISESSSQLLPKIRKDIEMRLWMYLLKLFSHTKTTGYVVKRIEEKVEAEIIPEDYIKGSKRKRLETDFAKAVKKMIEGGLLTEEGITYEMGKDGITRYYVFHLNPRYHDTTTPLLPPEGGV